MENNDLSEVLDTFPAFPSSLSLEGKSPLEAGKNTMQKIQEYIDAGSQTLLLALSGVPGGGKSTYAITRSQAINTSFPNILSTTTNNTTSHVFELDKLMSVTRGAQKMDLLTNHSIKKIREKFFRTQIFQNMINDIHTKEFHCNTAYTGHSLEGTFSAQLPEKEKPGIIIAEGVFAHNVAQSCPDTPSISNLFYPDMGLALLNTVKRGIEDPTRQKKPEDAFLEFLRFHKIMIGSISQSVDEFDTIITPNDLNSIFKKDIFTFLQDMERSERESMLTKFSETLEKEHSSYPIIETNKQQIESKIDNYSEYLRLITEFYKTELRQV